MITRTIDSERRKVRRRSNSIEPVTDRHKDTSETTASFETIVQVPEQQRGANEASASTAGPTNPTVQLQQTRGNRAMARAVTAARQHGDRSGNDAPGASRHSSSDLDGSRSRSSHTDQSDGTTSNPSPEERGRDTRAIDSSPDQLLAPLTSLGVQPKLTLGRPDDKYEREADVVASTVVSGATAPPVSVSAQPTSAHGSGTAQAERELVQTQISDANAPDMQPLSTVARTIRNPGTGRPLPRGVRQRIEPTLGTSLDGVTVHTGSRAATAVESLGARAVTHSNHIFLGNGESTRDVRLMAHEATHVVQQGATTESNRSTSTPEVQRFLPQRARDKINEYARHIPGWTLFTVLITYNPLTREKVERTPSNLLEGLIGLVPLGTVILDALRDHGIIQEAFEWVEGELSRLELSRERIQRTIKAAWDDFSLVGSVTGTSEGPIEILQRHFGELYDDVKRFAGSLVDGVIRIIREAAVDVAERFLGENRAWELITKILGRDPLREVDVPATPTEILEDFLLLIGKEQHLEQMREHGTLEESAEWVGTRIEQFRGLLSQFRSLIARVWETITPINLPDLRTNIDGLASDVGTLLQDVWDFASTVASEVLQRIKNALLGFLNRYATDELPGFHLMTVIIGRNPFTRETVPRSAEALLRGFITLLPGGTGIYERLAESGIVAEAGTRIDAAVDQLGLTWEYIVGIFSNVWESVSIEDLVQPTSAFERIVAILREPVGRIGAFIRVVLREIFTVGLEIMRFPSDLVSSIIANTMQAFEDIKTDPIGFFLNLLDALKQGFESFFGQFLTHLGGGLVDWLSRGLRDAGIAPPRDFSLQAVLDFVLNVVGITTDRIWELVADRIGQENVERIQGMIDRVTGIWSFVRDVQNRGVSAIWEYIKTQISGLWDTVLAAIQEWIVERVIKRATQWLMSLLDPTGVMAVINSFQSFFNAVQSAIEYLHDILGIVNDYVSTISSVAKGELAAGAEKLEEGLANAIPIVIGFLANQLGLGNIGERIKSIVTGIRDVVDRALLWLMDRAERAFESVISALGFGDQDVEAEGDEDGRAERTASYTANGDTQRLRVPITSNGAVILESRGETVNRTLDEFAGLAMGFPDEMKQNGVYMIQSARRLVDDVETNAQEAASHEVGSDDRYSAIGSLEESLVRLASTLEELQTILPSETIEPEDVIERVKEDVRSLPEETRDIASLSGQLERIFSEYKPSGLKKLYVQRGNTAHDIVAEVNPSSLISRFMAYHERSRNAMTFCTLRINGVEMFDVFIKNEPDSGEHAEERLLREFPNALTRFTDTHPNSQPETVEIFVRYTPCNTKCTPEIIDLKNEYPELDWTVRYAELYEAKTHPLEEAIKSVQRLQEADIRVMHVEAQSSNLDIEFS